jgi:DNA-binding CsgD family transcriptional regulator
MEENKAGPEKPDSPEALLAEVERLRAECDSSRKIGLKYAQLLSDIGERVKELNCLYGISKVVEKYNLSGDDIFKRIIDIMCESWQYPESTCVRLSINYQEYTTKPFRETSWCQSADIFANNEMCGSVEVFYMDRKPDCDEGPFLKEERNLLNAVAERLGKIIERRTAEQISSDLQQELLQKSKALEETNVALNIMLRTREEEIKRHENMVAMHINSLILPYMSKILTAGSKESVATYISIVEKNLGELAKTHITKYPDLYMRLTPTEIKVTDLIVDNKSSAEVSQLLHLSEATVNFHRKNIRKKLGLTNQNVNLRSYLHGLLSNQE